MLTINTNCIAACFYYDHTRIPTFNCLCSMLLSLPPVNCSDPTLPMDGSIDPYQNTTEGAEIFFRCNPGFVPSGNMTAVCGADGRWNPDPATLVCTCEYLLQCMYTQNYY